MGDAISPNDYYLTLSYSINLNSIGENSCQLYIVCRFITNVCAFIRHLAYSTYAQLIVYIVQYTYSKSMNRGSNVEGSRFWFTQSIANPGNSLVHYCTMIINSYSLILNIIIRHAYSLYDMKLAIWTPRSQQVTQDKIVTPSCRYGCTLVILFLNTNCNLEIKWNLHFHVSVCFYCHLRHLLVWQQNKPFIRNNIMRPE